MSSTVRWHALTSAVVVLVVLYHTLITTASAERAPLALSFFIPCSGL